MKMRLAIEIMSEWALTFLILKCLDDVVKRFVRSGNYELFKHILKELVNLVFL